MMNSVGEQGCECLKIMLPVYFDGVTSSLIVVLTSE
jgi:hypothetical protein